jgi:predicted transcriptional regulator
MADLPLSRRERQIMDLVYRMGQASAADVHRDLPDAPTYTTVRGLLRILVEKGHLQSEQHGKRYMYKPSTPRPAAGASSIAHVVNTFFAGSPSEAFAALLGGPRKRISDDELERLSRLVAKARRNRAEERGS